MTRAIKISLLVAIVLSAQSCKKDNENTTAGTAPLQGDELILSELKSSTFTYYINKDTVLIKTAPSPHSNFKLKFNSIAAAVLGNDGKLPSGATFPDGSLIVKEVHNSNGGIDIIAAMRKDSKASDAAGGWLWNEVGADLETVVFSTKQKGAGCFSCHSSTNHRDYVSSFDLH